jgi:general secretion pathway protein E
MRRKVITETQLLDALSEQYEIPFWPELPLESFGEDRTRSAPIGFLKRHAMVPLVLKNIPAAGVTTLPAEMVKIIAVNDPAAFEPLDDLARMIGFSAYNLVLSTKSAIFAAINLIFDMSQGHCRAAGSAHGRGWQYHHQRDRGHCRSCSRIPVMPPSSSW